MKKQLLFLFLTMMACGNQDTPQVNQEVYEGTINDKTAIVLTLTRNGESVFGNVAYKDTNAPITILGSMSAKSARFQEVKNDGSITGIYSLEPTTDGWQGTWTAPTRDAENQKVVLKLTSQTKVPAEPLPDLTGTYQYSYGEEAGSGEIKVVQISPDRIEFAVSAVTGGPAYNVAQLQKMALELKGNQALYENKEFGKCRLRFVFVPNGIVVDYVDEAYECGFGNAATAAGSYIRTNAQKPTFEESL